MAIFTFEPHEYKRDLDIVGHYISQSADYLSRISGDPLETTTNFVMHNMKPGGLFPLQDPAVTYLARETRGNREYYDGNWDEENGFKRADRYDGTFLSYLKRITDNDLIVAPTFTVTLPPKFRKSIIASYIGNNLKLRKKYKSLMFELELQGDVDAAAFYDIMQTVCKIKNNSVSGAHASPSTVLYNKSSHSILTSTCRIATGYGNANNEKFIMGNRHYWCPDVVLANIMTIIQNTDYVRLQLAIDKYDIYMPNADDVMECIEYSTRDYWRDLKSMERIRNLVSTLKPIEAAAFVYTVDLYHLAKHNPDLVRRVITDFSKRSDNGMFVDPDSMLKKLDGYSLPFSIALCSEFTTGISLGDLKKTNPIAFAKVAATGDQLLRTVDDYAVLIQGLWRPKFLNPSVAMLPSIKRKAVVTSDTDSSIFTTQYWTEWFVGKLDFSKTSFDVANTICFLTAKLVSHNLALMSANLGVDVGQIHQLNMKNEYYFPLFVLTPSAKHYYAEQLCREGSVYKEPKLEIKGVELRSSNAPDSVMKELKRYVLWIMATIKEQSTIGIKEVLKPIYDIESAIMEDIETGGHNYLRSLQIKDPDSYVDKEDAHAYKHHLFWEEVFAPKYGSAGEPPYAAIKVSLAIRNKTTIQDWIDGIKDRPLADRLRAWFDRNGKNALKTVYLPGSVIEEHGVPEEILAVTDKRRLLIGIVSPFYLVLESLGIYMRNNQMNNLVYDIYNRPKFEIDQKGLLTAANELGPVIHRRAPVAPPDIAA